MKKIILFSFLMLISFSSESFGMEIEVCTMDDASERPTKRPKFNSNPYQQDETLENPPQEAFCYFFTGEDFNKENSLIDLVLTRYDETKYWRKNALQYDHLGDLLAGEQKKEDMHRLSTRGTTFVIASTSTRLPTPIQNNLRNNLPTSPKRPSLVKAKAVSFDAVFRKNFMDTTVQKVETDKDGFKKPALPHRIRKTPSKTQASTK